MEEPVPLWSLSVLGALALEEGEVASPFLFVPWDPCTLWRSPLVPQVWCSGGANRSCRFHSCLPSRRVYSSPRLRMDSDLQSISSALLQHSGGGPFVWSCEVLAAGKGRGGVRGGIALLVFVVCAKHSPWKCLDDKQLKKNLNSIFVCVCACARVAQCVSSTRTWRSEKTFWSRFSSTKWVLGIGVSRWSGLTTRAFTH